MLWNGMLRRDSKERLGGAIQNRRQVSRNISSSLGFFVMATKAYYHVGSIQLSRLIRLLLEAHPNAFSLAAAVSSSLLEKDSTSTMKTQKKNTPTFISQEPHYHANSSSPNTPNFPMNLMSLTTSMMKSKRKPKQKSKPNYRKHTMNFSTCLARKTPINSQPARSMIMRSTLKTPSTQEG